jgi:hypothetical protein
MGIKLISHVKGRTKTVGPENWVLRRILGSETDEEMGGWRQLHNAGFRK